MYNWRKLNPAERQEILRLRKQHNRPWHSPPHWDSEKCLYYIVSGSCYEHKPIIGKSPERLFQLEKLLWEICDNYTDQCSVWCILPNHYHLLVKTEKMKELRMQLGKMHGRTARIWNIEDNCVGRKVWFNCVERIIRSKRHYWATINYIHHNPVKHGYAEKWDQWLFSSATHYLNDIGKEKAAEIWKAYPILDYGKKWDI